jgi:class 3 adenylate cyclase
MELLADRDPEDARKLLDPVLRHMMDAVHRYEGTVNQVMGDGIMALFGAPLAHEDHAVRACYAALRMQESVKRYSEEVRLREGVLPQIRVGLNSGEVVVRAIGSDLHMDYTAVGQTTHLAARMEQMAAVGSILMTTDTLRLAEGYIEVKPVGPVNVKGLGDPIDVCELMSVSAAKARLQARRRSWAHTLRRTRCRARAALPRAAACRHWSWTGGGDRRRGGGGQVTDPLRVHPLTSHAGLAHARGHLGLLRQGDELPARGNRPPVAPFSTVIGLLRGYFKIQERDDLRESREKVTGKLLTLDEALKPTLPALLALLDVSLDDVSWQTLDPGQRRDRMLDAVKRLLLREAREQALLLIFEDLHWIDGETQALLDGLVSTAWAWRACCCS